MRTNQFHIHKVFSLYRDPGTHPSIPSGGGEALWSKSEKEQRISPPGRRLRGGSGNTVTRKNLQSILAINKQSGINNV
ncbi:MAG: hypothetical protein RLN83_10790 [Balneola sp.]|jgi:hypothetical protein